MEVGLEEVDGKVLVLAAAGRAGREAGTLWVAADEEGGLFAEELVREVAEQ